VSNCHTLQFLVQAVVLSLIFGMAAMVVFFLFDLLSSRKIGPLGKSSVLGMGLFLIFILVQSAICTWALARESHFWSSYYSNLYQELGYNDAYGVSTVKTYGNTTLLFAAGAVAVFASFLLFVEAIVKVCWKDVSDDDSEELVSGKNANDAAVVAAAAAASTASTERKSSWWSTKRSSTSSGAATASRTTNKDEEMMGDNTSSTTLDPPKVEVGYGGNSSAIEPSPDTPSWLTGDNI